MSNVSVILCVPHLIKNNCYSIINTVTEPMQCNTSTPTLVEITNKIGAYMRVEEYESQRLSVKMVDNNIYDVEFVDSIQHNQMIGDTPNYCIPLSINAITVQGMSYSDPYFISFNLKYDKMASGSPKYMNKSDYAFNSSVCIKNEPCKEKTQLLNVKSAHNVMKINETRMLTDDKTSERMYHDNKLDDIMPPATMKTFVNGDLTFDDLLRLVESEDERRAGLEVDSWGTPRRMRLCGGGESSLNAASGWGSPPSANNNAGNWGGSSGNQSGNGSNNTQQWNNTAQRPPVSQADMDAGGNNGGAVSPTSGNANGPNAANNGAPITSSAKIEQLNSMREALFSQEGWGGQHVNQDTNWDVPGSPEPGGKVEPNAAGGPPAWKPNVPNGAFLGTDLWEANLRNGGQPPPQPASKTPWGHTPTSNIGGTWGEDDDAADAGNVWTGPPPPQQWGAAPPHQSQWRVPKKDDWSAWGEPPRDMHYEGREPRPPQDPRHDLRGGISGRLNGDMWQQHQHPPPPNKMMPGAVNQWPAQPPQDKMKPSGWEEPSPPAVRRAAPFDEGGTSLWARGAGGAGAGRGGAPPPSQPPPRLPAPGKPDAVWGAHPPRNGAWEDGGHWPDRDAPAWPDAAPPPLWPGKTKPAGPAGWPDDIGEWGGPKPSSGGIGKQIPKEMLYNSKQFRFLIEMGYKKEEVESALRSRDMNAEEALELLAAASGGGGGGGAWRRDDHYAAPFPPQPPHKLLQPPHHHHHHYNNPNSGGTGNSGQPSTAQLRMLVQQIQMAVTAGYLNHQILNQPLAPQTLVLLNQLLQQIKVLQQLVQQHSLALSKANSSLALQCSVQISKSKQQITALQNQIATQQALYMKQQSGGAELLKQSHDALVQLQGNLSDMTIGGKDAQSYGGSGGNQQSRLNQWKLPALDKEGDGDFSRAPGAAKAATSPQLNQLALHTDPTWGVGREGWGEGDVADGKDWPHPHQPVYDLVPEFEPGKPWKMKSVEDDPSMTPGSVVRSPLSLTAIKESDMLSGKSSPPAGGERSLSSATWSYAPPAAGAAAAAAGLKPAGDWGGKARAQPPPGLNKGWPQHHAAAAAAAAGPPRPSLPASSWQASTWLLLKNLTAQIDGSTLKTLCVQHGPLQNFHLYLNQGIALARYSSREEAAKAQMALNNCVLSNTTIFAESPAESDVQMILQHLGSGGGGAWRGAGGAAAAAAAAAAQGPKDWGFPAALWPEQEARATPSLNSFLPPDLLGGESL